MATAVRPGASPTRADHAWPCQRRGRVAIGSPMRSARHVAMNENRVSPAPRKRGADALDSVPKAGTPRKRQAAEWSAKITSF